MKKIECLIPNKKLHLLEDALRGHGIRGMTVSDVRGFGNEQTRPDSFLYLPKIKVELYCNEEEWELLVDLIVKTCYTGSMGDGKIAVLDVREIVRIRTGERGTVAV